MIHPLLASFLQWFKTFVKLAAWASSKAIVAIGRVSRKHGPNPWYCHRCVLPTPDNGFALESGWHSGWKNVERRCPCPLMSKVETCLAANHSLQKIKSLFSWLLDAGRPKGATEWPAVNPQRFVRLPEHVMIAGKLLQLGGFSLLLRPSPVSKTRPD